MFKKMNMFLKSLIDLQPKSSWCGSSYREVSSRYSTSGLKLRKLTRRKLVVDLLEKASLDRSSRPSIRRCDTQPRNILGHGTRNWTALAAG